MKACKASKFVGMACQRIEGCILLDANNPMSIYQFDPETCREALNNHESDPSGSGIEGCCKQEEVLRILRERAQ